MIIPNPIRSIKTIERMLARGDFFIQLKISNTARDNT
jgi:hypothetical protein